MNVISTAYSALKVFGAAKNIHDAVKDPELTMGQKAARIGFNTLVLTCNALKEGGGYIKKNIFSNIQYTAEGLAFVCAGFNLKQAVAEHLITYRPTQQKPLSINLSKEENLLAELQQDPEWQNDMREILPTESIAGLTRVPSLWNTDDELSQFMCSIKSYPIRHILVVSGTENSPTPVYYEESAILEYWDNHPQQPPPKWPAHIPWTRQNLIGVPSLQCKIDKRLEELLDNMKTLFNLYRIKDLCRQMKMETKSNDEIGDYLIEKGGPLLQKNIAHLNITTEEHKFEENKKTILARRIAIETKKSWWQGKTPKPLSETQFGWAISGMLGSSMPLHLEVLGNVLRDYKHVCLYISRDYRRIAIEVQS